MQYNSYTANIETFPKNLHNKTNFNILAGLNEKKSTLTHQITKMLVVSFPVIFAFLFE